MSSGNRHQVGTLIRRDGPNCHYCNAEVSKSGKKLGTRDHVVPRSLGGPNYIGNYVLACTECNVLRGNELVYCYCEFCEDVIDSWIENSLWWFSNGDKFKVFKKNDRWVTVYQGRTFDHNSFTSAIKSMPGIRKAALHNAMGRV